MMLWIKLDIPNDNYYVDISKLAYMRFIASKGELILKFINNENSELIIRNNSRKVLNQILIMIDRNSDGDKCEPLKKVYEVDVDEY